MGDENAWIHFTGMKYITQILRIRRSDSARVSLWTFVDESLLLEKESFLLENYGNFQKRESRYLIHRPQDTDTHILEG